MPTPQESAKSEEISSPRCQVYEGSTRDPSLQGTPTGGSPRCCESDFGLDVELVLQSCGLSAYLGESEELACVHRFADAEGGEHELRLSPVLDLDLDAAAVLHTRSGAASLLDARVDANTPGLRWLAPTETRSWVLVDGWPALRRLSWAHETCSPEAMQPVLERMSGAPAEVLSPLPRLEFTPRASERATASLLSAGADVSVPLVSAAPYALPYAAPALASALLHAAAEGELEAFRSHFSADARWGLPDRRQLAGRSLHAAPDAALEALAHSAARLPEHTQLHCPVLDRRVITAVERGEVSMWCLWFAPDQLDLIVLELRGRIVEGHSDARVTYLGVFPDAPLAPVAFPGEPPPPPVRPMPTIHCGDPHARDYPGLCPEEAPELDEDELGQSELDASELDASELDASELDTDKADQDATLETSDPAALRPPARIQKRGEVLRLPPLD